MSPATVSLPEWSLAIQPGLQYRLNSRFSIAGEFCVPLVAMKRNPSISDKKYFRFRGELKYYLYPKAYAPYVSLESSYAFREFAVVNYTFFSGNERDSVYSFQSARVHSPIWITNARFGQEYRLGPHFGFDFFIGIGFRNIVTQYSELQGVSKQVYYKPYCRILPSIDPAWAHEASIYRFNATFGFRIMYQL